MFRLAKSEFLKMRHTFAMKLVIFAPLATLLLGYLLSGSYIQLSAYNWWYTMILPIFVSMLSASIIAREKNTGMQNIICLPVSFAKIWLGKALVLTLLLFVSNLFLWLITTAMGFAANMEVSPLEGLIGCMLLFLTYLWQIPYIMLLTSFLGYLPAVLVSAGSNFILSIAGTDKRWFFLDPYAIPARVVCPFFKMHPNGVLLKSGSPLLNRSDILPGLLVSFFLAVFMLWMGCRLFMKGVQKYD